MSSKGGRRVYPAGSDFNSFEEERMLERENDAQIEMLSNKVSAIRQMSKQIQDNVRSSNTDVNGLTEDMNSSQFTLAGTTNQLKDMLSSTAKTRTCFIAFIIFIVFVFLYLVIKIYSWFTKS